MKRINFLLIFTLMFSFAFAQSEKTEVKPTFLLTGASFATSLNGWFEIGCNNLGVNPINRAIGGEAIVHTANRMIDGSLYSEKEFEAIDAFVIMQVHERDVFDESEIKENYTDYTTPFTPENYSIAYDYVIKRYIADCYNLKFNENSKYYNTRHGKPAVIVLCTHWHDARVVYNSSIRQLAKKWGLPLVEFDKYIGFSKESLHPVTGEQISLIYSQDTQKINDVIFGWHPERGQDKYIQQRMAAIFADTMSKIFILE
ncbi:MAG: DUF5040 domain-containing protein [Dysgonamonadaceae bacterium]|nr:DUF5040 domain-containing protein [Dysgonamonadaceae bacterium]MDD4727933.1 DUF5040 domain-containing protein [Dysgonamonadaceae bacterium]